MDLTFSKPSKESIEVALRWYKLRQHKLSKHLKESHIKVISKHLDSTRELVILAILNSLKRLGSSYDKLEEQHIFWLSLVRTCIEEKDPAKRWKTAKSTICGAITNCCGGTPVNVVYEILKASGAKAQGIPQRRTSLSYIMQQGSFVDNLLRTVILFNAMDIHVQSDVHISYKWKGGELNFCAWDFCRDGSWIKLWLENGSVKEEFIPKLKIEKDWENLRSYIPHCFLFEKKDGTLQPVDIKSFLNEFGIPSHNVGKTISLLFNRGLNHFLTTSEKIKIRINEITGRSFTTQEEIERELLFGYQRGKSIPFDEKYSPEYVGNRKAGNHIKTFFAVEDPPWELTERLLDLQALRIELGELYLSSLSKEEQVKTCEILVPFLGFDMFAYRQFRDVFKQLDNTFKGWENKRNYKRIQSILKGFKRFYSYSKLKKKKTQRYYVLLCLKVIKVCLGTNCSFQAACKIVSKNLKEEGVKLSLRAKLTPEFIRRRFYEIRECEDASALNSKDGLRRLYITLLREYDWQESDI